MQFLTSTGIKVLLIGNIWSNSSLVAYSFNIYLFGINIFANLTFVQCPQ